MRFPGVTLRLPARVEDLLAEGDADRVPSLCKSEEISVERDVLREYAGRVGEIDNPRQGGL